MNRSTVIFLSIVLVASLFLFIGGPEITSPRIFKELWQCGHVALFACLSLAILTSEHPLSKQYFVELAFYKQIIFITIITGVLALTTEFVQLLVGRSFETIDIVRDLIGGWLGLSVYRLIKLPSVQSLIFSIFFLFAGGFQLILVSIDEWYANQEPRSIANFESPFELSRWRNQNTELKLSKHSPLEGEQSLIIKFKPAKYPGAAINYFPFDWSEAQMLSFQILNSSDEVKKLSLLVYDYQHLLNGYPAKDSFFSHLTIQPGLQTIEIPLSEIENAPCCRKMNMAEILRVAFKMHKPETTQEFKIDSIKLE